ncbi:MAG: Na+:solute symporter [Candidatus Sumerlaeia bacterium]
MQLTALDWGIIAVYLIVSVVIGVAFIRKGSKSLADFFVSGRNVPWWLAGISMVATTFAADTPLAVTGFVIKDGIVKNWIWWSGVFSGMLAVFLFARLWRRSEVLTDVEFVEIRYAGRAARFLRGFRALYLALPINLTIIGWVCLGMQKVVATLLGSTAMFSVLGRAELNELAWSVIYVLFAVTLLYIYMSGLWGVVATDFFQFFIAMLGAIVLAIVCVDAVGGIAALKQGLADQFADAGASYLRFLPHLENTAGAAQVGTIALTTFLAYVTLQWWASSYPGAEPGGGAYVAQRMFSTRSPKESLLATLLFNVCHYALRPWPWILVALCALVIYPELAKPGQDAEVGYPMMIARFMPPGFLGLIIVSFLAAFMSTISTQINLAASYLVNDLYKPFFQPVTACPHCGKTHRATFADAHYVIVSRLATALMAVGGILVARQMNTVGGAWEFILALSAGTGAVFILRWYWWRINAWSEISAMTASFVIAVGFMLFRRDMDFATRLALTTLGTTIVWVAVTFLTEPTPMDKLEQFFAKVRPGGIGWAEVARRRPDVQADTGLIYDFGAFVCGSAFVLLILFGSGKLFLGYYSTGIVLTLLGAAAGGAVVALMKKKGWDRME